MTDGTKQDKQVEDLMISPVLVKDDLTGIDDAADGIHDASGY